MEYYHTWKRLEDLPLKDYWQVLNHMPFLETILEFPTSAGNLLLPDIRHFVERQESLFVNWGFLSPFQKAILLKYFSIKYDPSPDCYDEKIFHIGKKESWLYLQSHLDLPPGLFLYPLKPNTNVLVFRNFDNLFGSCSIYNAGHPFSVWLLKNQEMLQNEFPGVYHVMVAALKSNSIHTINSALAKLRQFSRFPIEIPDDLSLDKDF